jgi:ABC-type polysaccharide/polyol phosphate transport system ATPase subunit
MSRPPSTPVAVEVRHLRKAFRIPRERQTMLKERVLRPRTWLRGEARLLEALRDISFDVHRGEFFGVIGRNGCGKSTLLKLLASIYRLDHGSIRVGGRLAPFIELGVGFNPELPAADNVLLNGVMMGLSPSEARSRFDRVIDYAELGDYTDLKLKNYSLGMQVRLAFSMMLEADADVLLVDEVLAVGDLAFQEKCIASLERLKARGTTIVFVTHDMDAVRSHCDKAILIEDGLLELSGDPEEVTERYLEVILPQTGAGIDSGRAEAAVVAAWIAGPDGGPSQATAPENSFTFNARIRARTDAPPLRLDLELRSHPGGAKLGALSVGEEEAKIPALRTGDEVTLRVAFAGGSLQPGEYRLGYELFRAGERAGSAGATTPGSLPLDRCGDPLRIRVLGENRGGGVQIAHTVSVEHGGSEAIADTRVEGS